LRPLLIEGVGGDALVCVPTNRGYIASSAHLVGNQKKNQGPLGSEIFCLQELQQTADWE